MRKTLLALLVLLCASAAGAAPVRKALVMAKGQRVLHTADGSVITVTTAPLSQTEKIVRVKFDQYGQTVSIEALKPGEVKLLLEYTNSTIGEVVQVLVTEPAAVERQRFVASSVSAIEGLSPASVHTTPTHILVSGELFSVADLRRCQALQSAAQAKRPAVVCGARLRSSAAAVFPDSGYVPAASAEIREEPSAGGAVDADSRWKAVIRLGDVPVIEFASPVRSSLVARAARTVSTLNDAAAQWTKNADSGRVYPTTFGVRRRGNAYALTMQWKFDQGRRGESLVELTPDDLLDATARSGGSFERLLQWWAATLHDAFRLYFMAAMPAKTGPAGNAALTPIYRKALEISKQQLNRASAPAALARAYTSMRWSSGADPFAQLLTTIPSSFQPDPILAQDKP